MNKDHHRTTFWLVFWVSLFSLLTPAPIQANNDLDQLKQIQAKVQQTVSQVMPACVAISDGVGAGSGVIVSADGLILTAGHVITDSSIYEIVLPSGRTVKARVLGKNLNVDAGMLQILETNDQGWPHVEMELNNRPQPGQWVVSLGHSGGFEIGRTPPVRTGRVIRVLPQRLITDAVLIGGDSGGPLFDLNGKLVGIHSSIGDSVAENRHVTMSTFVASWDRMKAGETWGALPELATPTPVNRRGIIGVRVDLKAPNCRIRLVSTGSPAAEAGIQIGDVILQFENTVINDGRHLIDVVKRFHAGDICRVKVLRGNRTFEFEVQLQ